MLVSSQDRPGRNSQTVPMCGSEAVKPIAMRTSVATGVSAKTESLRWKQKTTQLMYSRRSFRRPPPNHSLPRTPCRVFLPEPGTAMDSVTIVLLPQTHLEAAVIVAMLSLTRTPAWIGVLVPTFGRISSANTSSAPAKLLLFLQWGLLVTARLGWDSVTGKTG